jgi:hypothetical protein
MDRLDPTKKTVQTLFHEIVQGVGCRRKNLFEIVRAGQRLNQ